MNKSDLESIEKELNISLPKEYVDTMLRYPFENGTIHWSLWDDSQHIIKCSKRYRDGFGKTPSWPPNILFLGDDNDACPYAYDLTKGSVIKTDKGDITVEPLESYKSFNDFMVELNQTWEED